MTEDPKRRIVATCGGGASPAIAVSDTPAGTGWRRAVAQERSIARVIEASSTIAKGGGTVACMADSKPLSLKSDQEYML